MTKLFAAMLALCMLMTPVLSLAEVTPETLEGIYKGDALGYYAGWYKDINNVTRDVLFDQETLNRDAENRYQFHYICEEGEDILLYSNGFMFIQGTDGSVRLCNTEGTVIFSDASLGVTGFAMLDDNSQNRSFLADGYIAAYRLTQGLMGTGYELGILNTRGEWVVPLSAQHPLLTCGAEVSSKLFEKMYYMKEGVIGIEDRAAEFRVQLYSITNNAMLPLTLTNADKDTLNSLKRSTIETLYYDEFENGEIYIRTGRLHFTVHNTGEITWCRWYEKDWFKNSPDAFVTIRHTDNCFATLIYCDKQTQVVHSDGTINPVGPFRIKDCTPIDGGWMITAYNAEKTYYYLALNTAGAFLFEPVQTDAQVIILPDGRELECAGDKYGNKTIITWDGKAVYNVSNPKAELTLKNGVANEHIKNPSAKSGEVEDRYIDLRDALK